MKLITISKLSKVGFINRTHGYKGNLHCVTEISNPEKLLKPDFMFILINGLPVPFFIEELEVNGTEFYLKLEDINSDDDAKKILSDVKSRNKGLSELPVDTVQLGEAIKVSRK